MNSRSVVVLIALVTFSAACDAQVFIGGRMGRAHFYRNPGRRRPVQFQQYQAKFQPSLNISIGYGFPNLDKYQLPAFNNFYNGSATQNGPFTGSVDYRFSRTMSIGLLFTHGTVNMPYYSYNNASGPVMTASLDNWSYMLNFVRYMPAGKNVTPYIRTAIGVNSWVQDFTDAAGNKLNQPFLPSELAYQVGLGAKFNITKNAGLFVEAGYGKYILHGGLSFKF